MCTDLVSLSLAALLAGSGCATPAPESGKPSAKRPAPARYGADDAPAQLAPAIARADAAIRTLRERLFARLSEEIASAGPAGAVRLCTTYAPSAAAEVSAQTGVEVGRTGVRLRSPANAPRPWAAEIVAESAGRRAADVQPAIVDLGDRVGVLRPIPLAPACVQCHGVPGRIAPEVKAAIDAAYPSDRAVGFQAGDLRGWFWAEAKK